MQFLFVLCGLVYSASANVAPFLTPCRASDSACLLASAKKAVPYVAAGVPELGLPALDPMTVDRLSTRELGIELDAMDVVVRGFNSCDVTNLTRNDKKINLDMKCPALVITGDYTVGGKLLVLPVEGKGKYKIDVRDFVSNIQLEVADTERGGENYWTIANWKYSSDVLTNVHYAFENLFNGNKAASDVIHQFANSNWREIYNDVGAPATKTLMARVVAAIGRVLAAVPVKEITID